MPVKTQGNSISDVVALEIDPLFNRESKKAGAAFLTGQILKLSSGELIPITAAGDTIEGVAIADAADDQFVAYIARGPGVLLSGGLIYFDGATSGNKTTVNTALAAKGFVIRSSI